MIIHDHSLEHEYTACTTVFQLLPLQNLLFLMTKLPTTDQKVTLSLISKQHWTHTKVTYPYYLPVYSTPCTESACIGVAPPLEKLTWGHSNTVYLLMKNFRNSRARQPTNHYFEHRRATTKTGKNPSLSIEPWWKGPGLRLIARWSFFECAKFSRIILNKMPKDSVMKILESHTELQS